MIKQRKTALYSQTVKDQEKKQQQLIQGGPSQRETADYSFMPGLSISSQGHNLYKLQYISLEEVKIVSFQQ